MPIQAGKCLWQAVVALEGGEGWVSIRLRWQSVWIKCE